MSEYAMYQDNHYQDSDPDPDEDLMRGDPFVIEWEGGGYSSAPLSRVSWMLDLADCDAMDGVKTILACGNNGKLQPVHAGPQRRNGEWESENSIYYAQSELLTEDGRLVGTVSWSDH